jgi:polar amino acid transport system substrate-binding protein
MKKSIGKIVATVCLASMVMGIGGCSSSSNTETSSTTTTTLADNSVVGLVEDGKLTFVVDDSVVPCVYRDENNELTGFEYDCGNAIAEYLDLEAVWVTNAWENLITTVQAKKADAVIDGMYITEERKEAVNFCESYYKMDEVIVCAKGNDEIQTGEDLIGKKVGVQPASADLEDVKALGVEDISEYSRIPDGILDITNGRIDAFVTESLCAQYYGANGDYDIRLDSPIGSSDIGIATNQEAPEVTEAINSAIQALKADGTLSDISMKWFDVDIISD